MFTGIITAQGRIEKITQSNDVWRWEISAPPDFLSLPLGASVCCSGACLTIVEKTATTFAVEITTETQACTNFSSLAAGDRLNLEKAMGAASSFDGHIISGHIDGLATIKEISHNGKEMALTLEAPPELAPFIAAKGSVALDGVSLTVNNVKGDDFTLMLIPHTLEVLGWSNLEKSYCFNLEIDLISRYVVRYLERRGL